MKTLALFGAVIGTWLALPSTARACASCPIHDEVLLGTSDGVLVSRIDGEVYEGEENWTFVMKRDAKIECSIEAGVFETGTTFVAHGSTRCERLLGLQLDGERRVELKPKVTRRDLDKRLAGKLGPLPQPIALPAGIGMPRLKDADGYRGGEPIVQTLLLDGVELARIPYGASRWAITGYAMTDYDGIVIRMTTLLPDSAQPIGDSGSCTDYYDGYVMISTRRLEAARLVAEAGRTKDATAAKAFLAQATERDPSLTAAKFEIKRLARRSKNKDQCK